ncbi:MAG TPA: extracellular solute-binding protein [Xanthobacteraceae bacterium]|jgi:iron(III) transport system substrate-binding protein|nr:extracellular solute-binding protein [Xanthobacteraceae bacterium]
MTKLSRRTLLQGTGVLALAGLPPTRVLSSAPPAEAITPELIAAAKKEGKVVYYTSVDLAMAERISKMFEARFPGISVRVERSGAERIFQRIGQENSSRIHAVDVVNSSDAAHFIVWKRNGWLAPYVPQDVAQFYAAEHKDADGQFAAFRLMLSVIGFNTNMVKPEEAPKGHADLLEAKWKGKLVKAHPGYSGTIMTATQQLVRDIGWPYFEKLAQQSVMQVQSASDTPKKISLGERAVQADGNEYNLLLLKEQGQPVEPVYAVEGTPQIVGPNGVFKNAPNPNAARLFQNWSFTAECQQLIIDVAALRSLHPQAKEKPGRKPLKDIKTLKEDAVAVEKQSDEIKSRYSKIFKV